MAALLFILIYGTLIKTTNKPGATLYSCLTQKGATSSSATRSVSMVSRRCMTLLPTASAMAWLG